MARLKKIIIILLGLICAGVLLLLVLAKVLITPERVRESVVPLISEALHRDLQLGEIEISLLSGIVLNDVILRERAVDKPFISIEKAVLRYRLWPLFLLQVKVDELRLDRPRMEIIRFHDGSFNFSDMSGPVDNVEQKHFSTETDSGAAAVDLRVSEIVITDGIVLFVDHMGKEEVRHTVSSLNIVAQDFSLTEQFLFSLSADWNSNDLALKGKFDLDDLSADIFARLNALEIEVKGDLLAEAKGDRLRATIKLPATPVAALIGSLPKGLVALPEDVVFSGQLAARLVLDGLISDPQKLLSSGQIECLNVTTVTGPHQVGLNGMVLLERESLKTDKLLLKLNDQIFNVSAQVENLLKQPLKVNFEIRAERIDLNRIIPVAESEIAGTPSNPSAPQQEEIGPIDLPVDLKGKIVINELLYRELSLQKIEARLILKQNNLIVESLVAAVAGGGYEQTAEVDLGVMGFRYKGRTLLKGIQSNQIVKALQPDLSDTVFGVVDGRFTFNGEGTLPEAIKKRLNVQGDLILKEGKITDLPVLDSAAKLLGIAELKEIVIDTGEAAVVIKQGVVTVDMKTAGPELRNVTTGTVALSGPLDLKVNLALSPQLSKKLDRRKVLGEVLTDKSGWTHVPLRVNGDSSSPKVALDMSAIKEQAKQGAVDKLSERLKKELNRGKDSQSPPANDPTSKLIDSALKGLFGK